MTSLLPPSRNALEVVNINPETTINCAKIYYFSVIRALSQMKHETVADVFKSFKFLNKKANYMCLKNMFFIVVLSDNDLGISV